VHVPQHAQLWLVDADCYLYDSAPSTSDIPCLVHVQPNEPAASIATLRHFASDATTLVDGPTEARPLIRTELNVKTLDGEHRISGLVDCAATTNFVSKDFVRRFSLPTRMSKVKIQVRLANGQRVTSSRPSLTSLSSSFGMTFNRLLTSYVIYVMLIL
jgi:hypothetical protein